MILLTLLACGDITDTENSKGIKSNKRINKPKNPSIPKIDEEEIPIEWLGEGDEGIEEDMPIKKPIEFNIPKIDEEEALIEWLGEEDDFFHDIDGFINRYGEVSEEEKSEYIKVVNDLISRHEQNKRSELFDELLKYHEDFNLSFVFNLILDEIKAGSKFIFPLTLNLLELLEKKNEIILDLPQKYEVSLLTLLRHARTKIKRLSGADKSSFAHTLETINDIEEYLKEKIRSRAKDNNDLFE